MRSRVRYVLEGSRRNWLLDEYARPDGIGNSQYRFGARCNFARPLLDDGMYGGVDYSHDLAVIETNLFAVCVRSSTAKRRNSHVGSVKPERNRRPRCLDSFSQNISTFTDTTGPGPNTTRRNQMPLKKYGILKGKAIEVRPGAGQNPHYQVYVVDETTDYRIAINVQSKLSPSEL